MKKHPDANHDRVEILIASGAGILLKWLFISLHMAAYERITTYMSPGKDRWRNSHVLVYDGPLKDRYFLGVAVAIYFHHCVSG